MNDEAEVKQLSPTTVVTLSRPPLAVAGLTEADVADIQAMLSWWRSRQGQKERR